MEKAGTDSGKPLQPVKIVDCGEVENIKIPITTEKEKGNSSLYKMQEFCGQYRWYIA